MAIIDRAQEIRDLDVALTRIRLLVAELRRNRIIGRSAPEAALKFNPDQPRVPAGRPGGGQWTDGESGNSSSGGGIGDWFGTWLGGGLAGNAEPSPDLAARDNVELSEWVADPDDTDGLPIHLASNAPRNFSVTWPSASPAQLARFTATSHQAQSAIQRVREFDVRWQPGPSISEGIEGAINTNLWIVQRAEARLRELQSSGIGLGPFAQEWIPARGAERNFYAYERREMNKIGSAFGCHTCGTTIPGTTSRNFILDHQQPSALNFSGSSQRLFPHCLSCSLKQGGTISRLLGGK